MIVTDPIYILRFLFLDGLKPPPPGPMTCGPDPRGPLEEPGRVEYTSY